VPAWIVLFRPKFISDTAAARSEGNRDMTAGRQPARA
jgi:hypothetical protein